MEPLLKTTKPADEKAAEWAEENPPPRGSVVIVDMYHDDDCKIWRGQGICSCDPWIYWKTANESLLNAIQGTTVVLVSDN